MTLALLAAGHRVAAVARNPASQADANLLEVLADLSSSAGCERVVQATLERFGRIDALINNAGASVEPRADVRFYEQSVADWQAIVDVNLTAPFVLARLVAPAMVQRGWGRIVNTLSSRTTMLRAGFTPYGPTKAALEAATRAWASELAGTGVTVNAIVPGGASDTRRVSLAERPDRSGLVAPAVMGPPIVWLLSTESDSVTGTCVVAREWNEQCSHAKRTIS
jgi:3-oxoacyl-[acyl-carrier protein] reductase